MKGLTSVSGIALALAFTLPVVNADAGPFVWNGTLVKLVRQADPVNGAKLAKQHKCAKCHGDEGIAEDDDSPSLAGQVRGYHFKQFMDYRSGQREDKDMRKLARKLSDAQIADLAAYFEGLQPEQPPASEPPGLATEGDESRLLLGCNRCHGEQGEGFGHETPRLTGQKIEYFMDSMQAFRDSDRENDEYGRMRFIANRLSEDEIELLAQHYSMPPGDDEED